jgi:hypothetical protein
MPIRRRQVEGDAEAVAPIAQGTARRIGITDDMAGIQFEVGRMIDYVRYYSRDPLVVKTVELLSHNCKAKDHRCLAQTIFEWTKANFLFLNDPIDAEKIKSAHRQISELSTPKEVLGWILKPIIGKHIPGSVIDAPLNPVVVKSPFKKTSTDELAWVPDPKIVGDCDEGSSLLATLLASAALMPRFRFGGIWSTENGKKICAWHHVWVQVKLDEGWVDLDVTEEQSKFGWYFPGFRCLESQAIFKGGEE